MSILDNNILEPSAAQKSAYTIIQISQNVFDLMIRSFNEGSEIFWNQSMGASPSEISEVLGTNAAEIFYLHARLGELISLVKPTAIEKGLSLVGEFNINNDGSVTIISVPTTTTTEEPTTEEPTIIE